MHQGAHSSRPVCFTGNQTDECCTSSHIKTAGGVRTVCAEHRQTAIPASVNAAA